MSVKIKMIIGFIIILLMVIVQSYLIVSMNSKRDEMSQMVLALSQNNIVIKDRIIDAKTLEIDLFTTIQNNEPIETHARDRRHCYGISILLEEWYGVFVTRDDYNIINEALKQKILDLKAPIDEIRAGMEEAKNIPVSNAKARMKLYLEKIRPQVDLFRGIGDDFVGQNSQYYSVTNKSLLAYSKEMETNQAITIAAAIMFIIFIIFYSNRILNPLNWLMEGVSSIMKGNLDYKVKKRSNDELGRLADQFNHMTDEIKSHRENLEGLVKQRTDQFMEAKEEVERTNVSLRKINHSLEEANRIKNMDMMMAVNVQSSFLMKRPPQSNEWDVSFAFLPMAGVAGDVYDFYTDKNGNINGISLMDVSGHGIASGLITMISKSVTFRNFNMNTDQKLSRVIEMINDELIAELSNVDNYLTGVILRFTGDQVEYVNAGHVDLLMKSGKTGETKLVVPEDNRRFKGYFLGLEAMKMPFSQLNFSVTKGDTLFLYSDCLTESTSKSGEEFGVNHLMELLNEAPTDNASDTVRFIVDKLYEHTETHVLTDDLTIIAAKRIV